MGCGSEVAARGFFLRLEMSEFVGPAAKSVWREYSQMWKQTSLGSSRKC
jgi:hypothetical protein